MDLNTLNTQVLGKNVMSRSLKEEIRLLLSDRQQKPYSKHLFYS
jgi:hypothetical protein